jgi:FG-GAP-like repeat
LSGFTFSDWSQFSMYCTAFDYAHSGRADYLLCWQPNPTIPQVIIYKNNNNGTLTPIYQGTSLGGWNFNNFQDRVTPYDYDGSGKLDYLLIYRAGGHLCMILKNTNGVFTQVL